MLVAFLSSEMRCSSKMSSGNVFGEFDLVKIQNQSPVDQ